ncbi:inositol 1,4,5-trisphosphate 3-kinase [Capsaspora owczarzaki ATCC 30864]|uniref:Kinase n=1 Tax=Capsaspora owczarzaki (strain ATCC 30864) TaxID=595528 RepID=A0A0D2UJZ9_CAPO3|nr:inositol 1,4,5-trisphosphate 3-kinase [Capsaspora owczarzaki ATCC 30864]KJE95431.1 inositol 1,4,5-trisphosphate 3-kinase [Capsaspora owczarzaki ATCC 30864]|eukprot:XP_004345476.1 inositol 1,4,5-trisphosphate 3-kinase [Capsaspora owczarzaki ATCC 30864]
MASTGHAAAGPPGTVGPSQLTPAADNTVGASQTSLDAFDDRLAQLDNAKMAAILSRPTVKAVRSEPVLRAVQCSSTTSLDMVGKSLSNSDLSSCDEDDLREPTIGMRNGLSRAQSDRARRAWRKVISLAKILIHYSTRYSHQVAGHKDAFLHPQQGILCKRTTTLERDALMLLMSDCMREFVPRFDREITYGGETYVQMEDLLASFVRPSLMDIKMGKRTFLESEVTKLDKRSDLLEKMREIDPNEPTPEEIDSGGITKLRYMQFREQQSSSASLGFRVEGIKLADRKADTNFKTVKTEQDVADVFRHYLSLLPERHRSEFTARLELIRQRIESSEFFKMHEVVGSSLLFVYDHSGKVGLWLIDFAKTNRSRKPLTHRQPWNLGNQEDGYLCGLDTLIRVWREVDSSSHISASAAAPTTSIPPPSAATVAPVPATANGVH